MDHLPEVHIRSYFAPARVIKDSETEWLWVTANPTWQFDTEDEAQSYVNTGNEKGRTSGLDILNYPYFVVKVTETRQVERVH